MPPVLDVDAVSFAFGPQMVLDCASFSVGEGEFVALTGPNGAGKSTLLRVVLGLLAPASGTVEVFGASPRALRDRWRIGYVPQRSVLPENLPATVQEVVTTGRLARRGWSRRPSAADRDAVTHALESVLVADLRHRRMHELSGGQQQRVLIAKAFACEPGLLILDEPVAGIDVDSQRRFRDSLVHFAHEHGTAVFLVSHELGAVAADLDRVLVLRHGKIAFDGSPEDLTATGVSLGVHQTDLPLWLEDPGLEEPG
ncbi:MAG: metal ABC transporter ATP-binding protein [Actinomycetota bacterium]|nr:metal ABC transporter ATP-binding protein [Actinomycetota bacterium]